MRRAAAVLVVVAAIAAGGWWLLRPTPVAVSVVTVERGAVESTVANTRAGTVEACRRARLAPARGGQVANLPVDDGAKVEQGQLLLELWNDDVRADLELARRDAHAAMTRSREACVTADVAAREAERLTALRDRGLASEESADQAVGRAESTEAACEAAQDQAEVTAARIDVVTAQLEQTQLRAPFAGTVAEINGEVGEYVTPSPVGVPTPPTVDLIDTSCLYVSAPIDEVDAPRIEPGLPARISLDAFADRTFAGRVRRVAPYVLDQAQQARTVEVEAELDDPSQAGLLPGYSADVEVILASREDVLRVSTAVIRDDGTVLVLDPERGVLEERRIETGISNWEHTEVLDGLNEGDRVVRSIDREGVRAGAPATIE